MPGIKLNLKNVNLNVNLLAKQLTIKFYTGGEDVDKWHLLSEEQKKNALSKDWCITWWSRDSDSGRLIRENNIKAGVNRYKTKDKRMEFLRA